MKLKESFLKSHIEKFEKEEEENEIQRGESMDLKVYEKKILGEEKNFFFEEIERLKNDLGVLEEKKIDLEKNDFFGNEKICEEILFLEKQIKYLEQQIEIVDLDLKVLNGKNRDIFLRSNF